MAISQLNQGSATTTITYQAGDSLAAIRAIVLSWVTSHGGVLVTQSLVTSDVFTFVCKGGTAGVAGHEAFIELDYAVTDRIIARPYVSWSGSAGIQRAQTLNYFATSTGTESQVGQPLSTSLGGILFINCSTRNLYLYGAIPGQNGNITLGGTLICEVTRFQTTDTIGIRSPWLIMYPTNALSVTAAPFNYRFAFPRGADNGLSTSGYAGNNTAVVFCPESFEYYPNTTFFASTKMATVPDSLNGSTRAGPVRILLGVVGDISAANSHVGNMMRTVRKPGASVGDTIICQADSDGVPNFGGVDTTYISIHGGIGIVL